MTLSKAFIPYGVYWSTPFCRWQGSLASYNSVELAAEVARKFLEQKEIAPETFDGLTLGMTVPQRSSFYGAPWLAGMLGAPGITGATIAQACATSARQTIAAALEVEVGARECVLAVAADRTSNGPHIYYPNPAAPGGRGTAEDWVWDNFNRDPYARNAMIQTAENVAQEAGISREEQDQLTLMRHQQYQDGLADQRAFQRRYMIGVPIKKGSKLVSVVDQDEGVFPTTAEGLGKLRPVVEGGTVTFGTQTFPADGNAGLVVCSRARADALSREPKLPIQIVSYGEARAKKGFMAQAVVPAAEQAAQRAGVKLSALATIKTHNPFAVNDIYFCRQTGVAPESLNRYGSPLIYGHPQGPTGVRAMIEMIEELAQVGGGYGLFAGCAAGDTAMAVVLKVG